MSDWICVASTDELPAGTKKSYQVEDVRVIVIHLDGEFYAIEDLCTHDGGELSSGWLDGEDIVCPRHGAKFCVRTGEVTAPPAYEDVPTFPIKIEDNKIFVHLG